MVLFHCKVSHHSTNVKVQNAQCKGADCSGSLIGVNSGSPSVVEQ